MKPHERLVVSPLSDAQRINSILLAPSVADKIRHDGREPGCIEHPLASYYGAFIDDELVGVFLAIRFSAWEIETHAAILPNAIRQGRALARLFVNQMFADARVLRLTAYVTGTLRSAANFCVRLGFVPEGRRRNAVMIGGNPHDVLIYGLTRSDWVLRYPQT